MGRGIVAKEYPGASKEASDEYPFWVARRLFIGFDYRMVRPPARAWARSQVRRSVMIAMKPVRPLPEILMSEVILVRPIERADYADWRPLWDGYNRFYGRHGPSALPESITEATWERFFSREEPVHALVAQQNGRVSGIAHYLFHRSTTRLTDVCYLQDLFTVEEARGRGVGRQLIQAVYKAAGVAGSSRVYWQTKVSNAPGRALYDKVAEHQGFIVYSHEL